MAKKTKEVAAKAPKLSLESLEARVKILEGRIEASAGSDSVEMPDAATIRGMADDKVLALAKSLQVKTDKLKPKAIKKLLVTIATVSAGKDADEEDVNAVLEAVGVKKVKKAEDNLAKLQEYLGVAAGDDEEEEEEDDDDEDDEDEKEDSDDDDEEESDDEDEEDDDEEEEEKPKKKGKKKPAKDDEDEDEEEEDDDEDSDDEDENSDDDEDEEDDDDDEDEEEDEEESDDDDDEDEDDGEEADPAAVAKAFVKSKKFKSKDWDKHLAAANKAGGKFKKVENLVAAMVDDDGEVAEWGTAYAKDDEGHSCGLPMKDIKGKKGQCECAVTGSKYKLVKGELVEIEDEE